MIIRDAILDDIPEIKNLLAQAWQETYGDVLSAETIEKVTSVWHNPELFKIQIKDPSIYFVVAQDDDGRLLGMATAVVVDEQTCMLTRLYVHPAFQKRGTGTALMEAAISHFPNAVKIRIEVLEKNYKARTYYTNNGFVELEKHDESIGNDLVSTVIMEKDK